MKPTITITSKHLTLIFGILVGLIVVMLMMLRSPDTNFAASQAPPTIELPVPDVKILELKHVVIQAIEVLQ